MNDEYQLRKRYAEDIAFSLGRERAPAALNEGEIEQAGIRSRSSLQQDRQLGVGIKYTKLKGAIKYPLHCILDFLVCNQRNHTGDLSATQRNVVLKNLQKAHEQQRAKAGAA